MIGLAPPRLPRLLLSYCVPGAAGEALMGDLEEEFHHLAHTHGSGSARAWYWAQSTRSAWPALTIGLHRGTLGRLVAAVLLGVAILWIVGDFAMTNAITGMQAAWPGGAAPPSALEVAYMVGLLPACGLAGYVATWQGGTNGPLAGVLLAVLVGSPPIIAAALGQWTPPFWSHFAWFIIGPTAVMLGARRRTRGDA